MKTRTEPRRRHAAAPVTVRSAGWITAGLLLATAALGPAARSAAAASVDPEPINSGNPTCSAFASDGESWTQFKLQDAQLANGTYTDGTLTVTISNYHDSSSGTPGTFDWAADQGVDAVFVKAGTSKHNLYVYDPEATSDEGLSPQDGKGNGISHISFCYDADEAGRAATESPVTQATDEPSNDPTDPPSSAPSDPPSSDPTDAPSNEPSDPPSSDPTDEPSNEPSDPPSNDPSHGPSSTPSTPPSGQPSSDPTDPPSSDPTEPPSTDPTDPPSNDPTHPPISQPSDTPVSDPTDDPTSDPTDPPANDQAREPSASPTSDVLGAVSDARVTPPPTDTLSAAESTGHVESWRIIALGLAMLIVSILLVPSRPTRSRARH
jgi:hypothetical protein